MSRQRKRDTVLRLLRGEDLETLSRALGVTAATLNGWRDSFLSAGEARLATRPVEAGELESGRLKARLGEMLLERELLEAVFIAVDHHNAECVGIHAARHGTRFEALEPLRQGMRQHLGAFAKGVAAGLSIRHDHGSQYMSAVFQDELAFLGAESSPAFVRTPEGNGCAERFIRTLKENLLWVQTFDTVEQLRLALLDFRETYNTTWLIQRLDSRTPAATRQALLSPAALAA